MTHVPWIYLAVLAAAKVGGGLEMEEWASKHGGNDGFFTVSNERRLGDKIASIYPTSADLWAAHYAGAERSKGFGHAVVHRARHCDPTDPKSNDELARFRHPRLRTFYESVREAWLAERPMPPEEIFAAQERLIRADERARGHPGVYVNIDPTRPEVVDVGHSEKDATYSNEYRMVLYRVYPTFGPGDAGRLEQAVHSMLKRHSAYVGEVGRRREIIAFQAGHVGADIVHSILTGNYRPFLKTCVDFASVVNATTREPGELTLR